MLKGVVDKDRKGKGYIDPIIFEYYLVLGDEVLLHPLDCEMQRLRI